MLPQIIWSELYCVTTPFKAPTMKTLKKKIIWFHKKKEEVIFLGNEEIQRRKNKY